MKKQPVQDIEITNNMTTNRQVTVDQTVKIYENAFKNEPFVRVLKNGMYPNIKHVRGTNFCDIRLKLNNRTNTLIVVTAIDNLVKGASGQAVQNMNIMMGFDEKTAPETAGLFP